MCDMFKDTLLKGRDEAGYKPTTSQLQRHVLYHCAATTARENQTRTSLWQRGLTFSAGNPISRTRAEQPRPWILWHRRSRAAWNQALF